MKFGRLSRWIGVGLLVLLVLQLGIVVRSSQAQQPLWQAVAEKSIPQGEREIVPQKYRTFALNQTALHTVLDNAPAEATTAVKDSASTLELPFPDGHVERFRIVNSPIMEPALAAKFPQISTYLVEGLDTPSASGRLDWTPAGFHAIILLDDATVFIDPYAKGNTQHYISYYTKDFIPDVGKVQARLGNEQVITGDYVAPDGSNQVNLSAGPILRTYRLALAATGEYTTYHGGTVAGALSAMVTSVNRVDGVYEREVAVRMVLIANTNLLIYTNASTDPYTNSNGGTMLGQNQTNIDSVIGSANYDIGHVFSTGGGGVAWLGCVCNSSTKARGVTGSSNPVGDPYDIDYVAHEMGHQFGGNHTFNSITSSCSGNRVSSAAYEPGSGSTIMAYAGICGVEDLQPHSDPYFHAKSFDEIQTFITGSGNSCAQTSNTGNSAPTVNAGLDYTIPSRTPFMLVGSATDPNGDALTYGWEEFDLGASSNNGTMNTDDGTRPIFRSFNPTTSPTRTLPMMSAIVNNTTSLGEVLPTTSRTMNFRLTVRDNKAGGGGVNNDAMKVTSVSTAGPFQVTAPNTAVTWSGSTAQTVTWNVANTNLAPISCANVDIALSTDGGYTYPTMLLANTPNDGSETINPVGTINSTTARVRVMCSNNIFFDISNTNFTINWEVVIPPPTLYVYIPLVENN